MDKHSLKVSSIKNNEIKYVVTEYYLKNIIEDGLITFETSKNHSDGRINSIEDEDSIIEYIKGLFPLIQIKN